VKIARVWVALFAALVAVLMAAGCASVSRTGTALPDYRAIVAAPDQSDADRKNDERRKPELLLQFAGVRPGMRVLDMGAAAGYSSELLARSVGPQGVVYAQNSPEVMQGAVKGRLDERLQKPVMKNVMSVVRAFDDPIPPGVNDLDLVTMFYEYHDMPSIAVDRARMNKRIFGALKPGGFFVIADHAAKAGAGTSGSKTLHRIEEDTLKREVEAAGFRLAGEADFLRNPADRHDELVFRMKAPVDNFVVKFVKP